MDSYTLCVIGLAAYGFCEVFGIGYIIAGGEWPSRPLLYQVGAIIGEVALVWVAIRGL